MNHEPFEELLVAEALGDLQNEERLQLQHHLRAGCQTCRQLRNQFKEVAAALADVTVERSPSPELKTRLLGQIQKASSPLPEFSKRPFLGWLLPSRLAWAATGSFAVVLAIFVALPFLKSPELYAQVIRSKGNLIVEGKPIGVNGKIFYGRSFSTGNESSSDLRIANAVVFHMGPNTQAQLAKQGDRILLELKQGSLFSHVKTGTKYAVLTPVATAEARGTVFLVKMDAPQAVYICLCTGHLRVLAPSIQQDLVSSHHKAVQVFQENGKTVMTPAPMRDHPDDTQFMVESF
jgi:hypothetical protein